tara:strand:- start:436 stop:627 length:192 start_codon:yes stop_codon:yes gene_type:complete
MKYYIRAIFEQEPMVVAWELFVFFMLCMFISIIFRLARIEKKVDGLIFLKKMYYKYYEEKKEK